MYTKSEIIKIAKEQLAIDYNCKVSDFEKKKNTVVENKIIEGRRSYGNNDRAFRILTLGGTAIVNVSSDMLTWAEEKLTNESASWFFEISTLKALDKKIQQFGHEIVDVHHYYLPNPNVPAVEPSIPVKWYEADEILQFEDDDRFSEALDFYSGNTNALAVAAIDGDNIMGMAGATTDSKNLWQIGVNVLPEYRGRGIGRSLTTLLKNEILRRGKIPFYGTVESHIHSQNIAISSGFFPAWAECYSQTNKD